MTNLGVLGLSIGTDYDSIETITHLATWGSSGSSNLSDSSVRLPICTTGTVDIFINASLVTVVDPTGFTVGAMIIFRNALNIGEDLIVTIASIDGNEITLNGSAGVSVTDDFCLIDATEVITITPAPIDLTLTGYPPSVPQEIVCSTADLTTTTYPPTISIPVSVIPTTTALGLSTNPPTVTSPTVLTPGNYAAATTGYSPYITGSVVRCTQGTVDIFINASLVTVTDSSSFRVGQLIRFKNALNIGEDLVVTIASIDGNEITLNGSAGVSVTDDFCPETSNRWYGPFNLCGCCHECDSLRYFSDGSLTLTDMALGNGSLLNDYDRLHGTTPQSWTLPAFTNDSAVIDNSSSIIEITTVLSPLPIRSPLNIYDPLDDRSWGGALSFRDNLYTPRYQTIGGLFAEANASGVDLEVNPTVEASVWYWCGPDPEDIPGSDPVPLRRLNLIAKYCIQDLAAYGYESAPTPADFPGWTHTPGASSPGQYNNDNYTATVDDVHYLYTVQSQVPPFIFGGKFLWRTQLTLYAYKLTRTPGIVSIELLNAPAYPDPWGLLLGKATVL